MMYQYVSNNNSYSADGSIEYDGPCQLLLLVVETTAGTATKFFTSVSTRTIYIRSHRVYEKTIRSRERRTCDITNSDAY
jgi:hypothetical protein